MSEKNDPLSSTLGSVVPEKFEAMKDSFFKSIEAFKSLEESGSKQVEAANKFQAGLDKVVDVLLILVMKFGRASTMLLANGIVTLICLVALIIAIVQVTSLRFEVKDLLDRQEAFSRAQDRIEKTTTETKNDVANTNQKVSETQAKVDDVAQASPKVEVDKNGKAKLVVSVPPKGAPKLPAPPSSAAPPAGRKLVLPLE